MTIEILMIWNLSIIAVMLISKHLENKVLVQKITETNNALNKVYKKMSEFEQ